MQALQTIQASRPALARPASGTRFGAKKVRANRFVIRAEAEAAEAKPWAPPALDPNTPSPIFGGSTGSLNAAKMNFVDN